MEEDKDFECVFVVYCVLEWKSIDKLQCVMSVSCTKINHLSCALMIRSSLQLTSKQ